MLILKNAVGGFANNKIAFHVTLQLKSDFGYGHSMIKKLGSQSLQMPIQSLQWLK